MYVKLDAKRRQVSSFKEVNSLYIMGTIIDHGCYKKPKNTLIRTYANKQNI